MTAAEKIEKLLKNPFSRVLFKVLTAQNKKGECYISRAFTLYGNKEIFLKERIFFAPFFFLISLCAKKWNVSDEMLKEKVFGHSQTRNAIVTTLRSIGEYGLTLPQVFSAPLMVVWNFTNACNLKCIHCYQNAGEGPLPDELSRAERFRMIDEMVHMGTVMLAISGGEPLTSNDFWDVAEYAYHKGLHISVATNGTLITPEKAKRLYKVGVRYAEVSIDSVKPEQHNAFRGAGCWEKAVEGIKNLVAVGGIRVGLASTITRLNYAELEELIQLAKDLGCKKFCAFNFVPTGRGKDILNQDLDPRMREEMLKTLYKYLEGNSGIDIMTTSPQISRVCLHTSELNNLDVTALATAHIATTKGKLDVKTFAKYMGGCGAGRCYWALQPNGLVTPCVFMPITLGDLRTTSAKKIWNTHPVLALLRNRQEREGGCLVCKYKLYCGGCRARPWGYFQDLKKSDPGCINNQDVWDALVAKISE